MLSSLEPMENIGCVDGAALRGADRGSRAGRFRGNRLRWVLPKAPTEFRRTPLLAYAAVFDGIAVPARAYETKWST
jgi:hypothetical protein